MWMGRFAGPGGLLAVLLAAAQLKAVSGAYAHTRLLLLLLLLRLAVLLPGVALPTPRRRDAATPRHRDVPLLPPSSLPIPPASVRAGPAHARAAALCGTHLCTTRPPPARCCHSRTALKAERTPDVCAAVFRASSKFSLCAHRLEDVRGYCGQRASRSWILRSRISRGVRQQGAPLCEAEGRVYDPFVVAHWRLGPAVYVARLP